MIFVWAGLSGLEEWGLGCWLMIWWVGAGTAGTICGLLGAFGSDIARDGSVFMLIAAFG